MRHLYAVDGDMRNLLLVEFFWRDVECWGDVAFRRERVARVVNGGYECRIIDPHTLEIPITRTKACCAGRTSTRGHYNDVITAFRRVACGE